MIAAESYVRTYLSDCHLLLPIKLWHCSRLLRVIEERLSVWFWFIHQMARLTLEWFTSS